MPVKDAGGRTLGIVDELRIDDMTGALRAIVVRENGLAQAAADTSKTREIPADHLDVGDGEVHMIEEVPGHIAGRDTETHPFTLGLAFHPSPSREGRVATKVADAGTKDKPWKLKTPSGSSEYVMYRVEDADPPAIVCVVGKTELRYHLSATLDLHAMLKKHGDWMPLGSADEQKPAADGTVEAWGRSAKNPVKGWYGLKKGLRGRFGMYMPPLLEALGLGGGHPRGEEQQDACEIDVEGPPPLFTAKTLDDHLEHMSKPVFQAGISPRVVEAKWPTIKTASTASRSRA